MKAMMLAGLAGLLMVRPLDYVTNAFWEKECGRHPSDVMCPADPFDGMDRNSREWIHAGPPDGLAPWEGRPSDWVRLPGDDTRYANCWFRKPWPEELLCEKASKRRG
jgi:hypothetical protein